MPLPDPTPARDIYFAFLSILLEGAPFILLGSLLSGLIDAFLPANAMDKLLPRRTLPAVLVSGLLGIIFPVCECAIVPVIRRLVQKGLPLGCAMTYMLAAPIVNPLVALSTWTAFRGRSPEFMTCSRMALGYLIAVIVGLFLSRFAMSSILRERVLAGVKKNTSTTSASSAAPAGAKKAKGHGITHALLTAQKDFLDVAVYFVIGVAIASIFKTQIIYRPELQGGMATLASNHWVASPVLMALAFVLSLCSTTDAFIIAADHLFPPVAKLAFLVFGPMMDMKLLFLYTTVLKPKVVAWLAVALFVLVYLSGFAMEPLFTHFTQR